MKVRFYGKLADLFGSEIDLAIASPCTVAELRERLACDHPAAAEMLRNRRVRACVGDTLVPDSHALYGDTVPELLAPVSGG